MQTMQSTQSMQSSTEELINHHVTALMNNDLNAIMKDYTETSEIWTASGDMVGLEAISSFFNYAFTLFPKGNTHLDLTYLAVNGNKAFMRWTADSPVINVPFAADSFLFENGKIIWQTIAAEMNPK